MTPNFKIDLRLTASWSDANAPFEFQFVNPNNRFYNWNSDTTFNENKKKGVTMEEFVIDDALPGHWLVNIRYIGSEDQSPVPPYLKYTVYKNYGTLNEQKKTKLIKLDDQLRKVTLDSFIY
jgi:uncharacterized protein YfaP (DUF2135 family)